MEADPKPPSHISVQKFVALSLLGYLETLKRYGLVQTDLNYIFKPMQAVERMTQLDFDASIIDVMYQLDEIEALQRLVDEAAFAKAVDELLLPVIAFLRENRVPNDGSQAAITRLIQSPHATQGQ